MKVEDLEMAWRYTNAVLGTFKIPTTKEEVATTVAVWIDTLGEYELPIIKSAILERAKESDFFNIVKVAETCKKLKQIALGLWIDEEEVLTEIRNAVSYHKNRENFAKLTPFAKEVVGDASFLAKWALSDKFETVIMCELRKRVKNMLDKKHNEQIVEKLQIEGQKQIGVAE